MFSAQIIARIARLANTYDITVLVDELYARLIHDGRRFPHLAAEPGMFARTVTLLGPSKTELLSGYRLGVVVAAPEIINRVENVLSIMALRAPAYAQHVLLPWLRDDHEWLAQRLKEFTALRTLTVESLRRLPWLKLLLQSGTAYVRPDVSALGLPGPDIAAALLCEAGVLVSPGYQLLVRRAFSLVLRARRSGLGRRRLTGWLGFSTAWRGTTACRSGRREGELRRYIRRATACRRKDRFWRKLASRLDVRPSFLLLAGPSRNLPMMDWTD